jgi:hypothetical protein
MSIAIKFLGAKILFLELKFKLFGASAYILHAKLNKNIFFRCKIQNTRLSGFFLLLKALSLVSLHYYYRFF